MSYSASFTSRQAFNSPTERQTQRENALRGNPECGDAFDAAIKTAQGIIDSGAVVGTSQDCSVTISGHANPNHAPRPGYSNDSMTVSVYQK